jgi:hypothetical protein
VARRTFRAAPNRQDGHGALSRTMSERKFLKCNCNQCGGPIEFPADGIGMTIPCPHCGWDTELTLAPPEVTSPRSARSLKWIVAGAIILVLGIVGTVGALLLAQKLMRQPGARPATTGNAEPETRNVPASTTNGFSISTVRIEKTAGTTLAYATGTVKNQTDRQRFGVTVEIDLLDAAGKKIGATKDYTDTVETNATWSFRALVVQKGVVAARINSIREQH